jgi:hypothetical protein
MKSVPKGDLMQIRDIKIKGPLELAVCMFNNFADVEFDSTDSSNQFSLHGEMSYFVLIPDGFNVRRVNPIGTSPESTGSEYLTISETQGNVGMAVPMVLIRRGTVRLLFCMDYVTPAAALQAAE